MPSRGSVGTKTWRGGIPFLQGVTRARVACVDRRWKCQARDECWGPTEKPLQMSFSVSKASLISDPKLIN